MANHSAAAALLLMASLLVAVALSAGAADASLTAAARSNKMAAALRGANRLTVRRDANGRGYVVAAAAPVPELICTSVHEVQPGETCFTVGQGSGLTQGQFLSFNPNINCDKIFVGQWVCLDATPA